MSTEQLPAEVNPTTTVPVVLSAADESPEWRQRLQEAEKLAAAPLTPVHLKVAPNQLAHLPEADRRRVAWQQTVANCILVANQAHKWNMDVFACAACTYVVGNKLGYEGKLIAGVVNTRGGLAAPLQPIYSTGKGDALAAVIYGTRDGSVPDDAYPLLEAYADNEDRAALRQLARIGVLAIRISVKQAKTQNKMWTTDPEQKLWYTGATKWARRFAPELMLGILTDDDLQCMQETATRTRPEATQSRIAMVIPSTLDASGITSDLPDDPESDPQPQSPEPTTEPVSEPPGAEADAPSGMSMREEYLAYVEEAGTDDHLDQLMVTAESGDMLAGDLEIVRGAINKRKVYLSRGERSNG